MKRFLKIFTANTFGVFINILGQLFAVPLFLHFWNKQLYGEWLIMTTIPNLLWSIEGGLSGIAANRMTMASAKNNWESVNSIFQTTFLTQIILSLFIFVSSLLVISTINMKTALAFTITTHEETSSILITMICYMLFGLLLGLYRAAYRASQLEARGAMVVNLWRISDFCIIVAVICLHGHPTLLAKCLLAGVVLWTIIGYRDVTRKCPQVRFGLTHVSWSQSKELLIHGLPFLVSQFATAIYMQGYPLVVNKALGSASVVTFTTIRTLTRLSLLTVQTVAYSCGPQLTRSYSSGDWRLYYQLIKIMAATCLWAGGLTLIGLTVMGPWLLSIWTHGKVLVDHTTLFLFSLSIFLQGIWVCLASPLYSANKHHEFSYIYAAGTLLALLVASYVIELMGFRGVPIIMVVVDLFFVATGIVMCFTKLPEIRFKELTSIFTFNFYKNNLNKLLLRS